MFAKRTFIAPELRGDHWLNSLPVSIRALRGNVVLLFFWDYTCIRSLRMVEYIRLLHERYQDVGLVVIGVHSPAFDFARKAEPLEIILMNRGISFPVVLDNSRTIFESYRNSETPSVVIVDQEGNIRSQYYGRGKQQLIERDVQVCLEDSGLIDALPLPIDALRPEEVPGAVCSRETPQIFFGYLRGNIGNKEGYNPESVYAYEDPGYYLNGRFYLSGIWRSDRQSMRLEKTINGEGHVIVKYEGREVFALIGRDINEPAQLTITQDGVSLTEENKGDDVILSHEDQSIIIVQSPTLVQLVKNPDCAEHVLKISSHVTGIQMYSLTFIPGVVPELLGKN